MKEKVSNKTIDFSNQLTKILNYGAINLAIAIGYRTHLFDIMDQMKQPQTVSAIAEKAVLNERYVREWLGVMVSGGIIDLLHTTEGEDLFQLPKEHADILTRRAGNSNLGVYTQEIPLLTICAMEPIYKCFYTGDGLSYAHYPRFQNFMTQLSNAKHRQVLVNTFLPSIDDGRLIKKLKSGIRVCDLGCAEGIAIMLMAQAFPKSQFIGIDISNEAIEKATAESKRQGFTNIEFLKLDASTLKDHENLKETFDYVTAFDAIHDQSRPSDALKGIYHILKPGGSFSMIDIAANSHLSENLSHPMGPFLYTVSLMHCLPVGLMNGGAGLGMMWGQQKAVKMLNEAGFNNVEVLEIPEDPFNLHFFGKK